MSEPTIREQKKEQRTACLRARAQLTAEYRASANTSICHALSELPELKSTGLVLSYSAIADEVDLQAFHQVEEETGTRIAYPMTRPHGLMDAGIPGIFGGPRFVTAAYGIREPDPEFAEIADPEEIDVILVPCVGFDRNGGRLGHGAGYYDRYLPQCTHAKKILIAYDVQELGQVVTDTHDVLMDAVLTESGIYHFS